MEQRGWNSGTSGCGTLQHLIMEQWKRDDRTVEHVMVEQCSLGGGTVELSLVEE